MPFENLFKKNKIKPETKKVGKENLPVNELVNSKIILFGRQEDFEDGTLQKEYEELLEKRIFLKQKDEFISWLNKENGVNINTPIKVLINTNGTVEIHMDGNKRMFAAYKLGILPKDIPVKCSQYNYGFMPSDIADVANTNLSTVLQKVFEIKK